MSTKVSLNCGGNGLLYTVFCVLTAMIGHTIHGSLLWAIMDFIFCPFAWIKWIIYQEVNMTIIRTTFTWFFV